MTQYPDTTKCSSQPRLGRLIFSGVVLAFCGAAWVSPVQAQINPFRGYRGPTLTREDLDAGRAAAQSLLNIRSAVGRSSRELDRPNHRQSRNAYNPADIRARPHAVPLYRLGGAVSADPDQATLHAHRVPRSKRCVEVGQLSPV
jgi:hypothetical protein